MPSWRSGPLVALLRPLSSSYRTFVCLSSPQGYLRPLEAKSPAKIDGLYLGTMVHPLST